MKNRKCATLGVYTGGALIYKVKESVARRKQAKGIATSSGPVSTDHFSDRGLPSVPLRRVVVQYG